MHHKPDNIVRIITGGKGAENIANRLEQAGERYERESPDSIPGYLDQMHDGADGEEDYGEDAECE